MNKQLQKEFVLSRLSKSGEITRNECIKNYITRLSSIIFNLKKQGWQFTTFSRENTKPDGSKGKDFVYKAVSDSTQHLF